MDLTREAMSLGDAGAVVEAESEAEKEAERNAVHEAEVDLPAKEVFLTSSVVYSCFLVSSASLPHFRQSRVV